jgi:putative mRNA 3-end processing factor
MILSDFIVQTKTGLFCKYGDFYLDPKEAVKHAVISHAHGDHAIRGNGKVWCTKATSLFMLHRFKKNAAQEFFIQEYKDRFEVNDVSITFLPAGHMLGSALILMAYKGIKYLYTGDYKLQEDRSCEPIELTQADVLITETTFAEPDTQHPDPVQEIQKLNTTRTNILLGAYALGKSQRLVSLIHQYCPEKRILIHFSIIPYLRIYEQMGRTLGTYEIYDRKVMKHTLQDVIYIVPPLTYHSYVKAINVIRVFATGWKHLQKNNELQLYVSDHADWKDILDTIAVVKPKEVWTTHGSGISLKNYFKESLVVKLLN